VAVNVAELPRQIWALDGVRVGVGRALTVTLVVATAVQPDALVTVTEYGKVPTLPGVTANVLLAVAPVPKLYKVPPVALRVTDPPRQTDVLDGVSVGVGSAFTVRVALATAVQPVALLTVTE
jgi:hypothetical protein